MALMLPVLGKGLQIEIKQNHITEDPFSDCFPSIFASLLGAEAVKSVSKEKKLQTCTSLMIVQDF